MIDYDKIGKRISEQRKYIYKVSQERMAEDLGMYQADISNLEKAKKGSGITDLSKLELIADYFNIPLESLLFGREDKNMMKYEGSKIRLKSSKKKLTASQKRVLEQLTGTVVDDLPLVKYECGPYFLITAFEKQYSYDASLKFENGQISNPAFVLQKPHTYIFLNGEVIAAMVADITNVMQHLYEPSFMMLLQAIQPDILDASDVLRTLNPYWALWYFSDENSNEAEEYNAKMYRRMDELRASGQDRIVLYIESIFVREDCRRNGVCRMYIDLMKELVGNDPVIWLNMEPTAGAELEQEYEFMPIYTTADIGQLNMNASIAEHLGFKVDPDTWHRQSEVIDMNGDTNVETVLVRKCAYYLPEAIREVLKDDGDLVALGRAKQKLKAAKEENQPTGIVDVRGGIIDGNNVREWRDQNEGTTVYTYVAVSMKNDVYRVGASRYSVIDQGIECDGQIENYEDLDDAADSKYFPVYKMLFSMFDADETIGADEE